MESTDPILVTVTLLAVEPTDRALVGWFPFRMPPDQYVAVSRDYMLHCLNMTGAGHG